ncbi:MAG TPA: c-type cytochrome [Steroidobacteraceae bacterium]|nr:c-type cytochrome [Steroidobacteraceae bacterium]
MKRLVGIAAPLAIASGVFASPAMADAPAAFAACAACHSADGKNGLGPTLKGVYGRKAGAAEGFRYSPAMKKAGTVWDDKSLDSFLADAQKAIPGNTMPFPGVADAKQRAEIIGYLKTVK